MFTVTVLFALGAPPCPCTDTCGCSPGTCPALCGVQNRNRVGTGRHDAQAAAALALAQAARTRSVTAVTPYVPSVPIVTPVTADGHQCPKCGQSQYVVSQQSGSQHSHKCASCGTEWWHSTGTLATVASPQTLSLGSSSGGCANGACAAPQRQGLFGGSGLFGRRR